ncbi:hypothetical protein BGZ94_006035, partial [Podila epigama]
IVAALALLCEEQRRLIEQGVQTAIASAVAGASASTVTQRELDADVRDTARTLHKPLKPTTPCAYSGQVDADACTNFIENQEDYYTVVNLDEGLWVQYTALNLIGDAKSWWRASGLNFKTPWPIFKKAFTDFHTPPNAVSAACEQLESMKQGTQTVAAYTLAFRRQRRLVATLDDDTALYWYIKGLESETSKQVRLAQVTTLDEAVSKATLLHSILYPDGPVRHSTSTRPPISDQATPMDLDNLHVAINNLSTQVMHLQQSHNRRSFNHNRNNNYDNNNQGTIRSDNNRRSFVKNPWAPFPSSPRTKKSTFASTKAASAAA